MTQAVLAQGWAVTWGGSSVDEVTTLNVGGTAAQVDVTSHDSPSGFREFIAGLIEPAEIPMTVNYRDALHGALYDQAFDSANTQSLVLTDIDGSTFTVDAWISGFNVNAPATGEAQTADITFRTTGPVTRAS